MHEDLKLFQDIAERLLKAETETPVVDPIAAEDLYSTLDLTVPTEASTAEDFEAALQSLVLSTPRTATRQFFNQLFGGRQSKAVLGDLLATLLNNSMYTYKVAGAMVGIEKVILRAICDLIGYPAEADGTIATGGSMTNFMAMLMARDARDEQARHAGVQGKMIAYTSKESHYSIPKNAAFMGIGREQVRYVATDEYGVLRVDDLERQIERDLAAGFVPFFVNATAGTTVLGAFDPIAEMSKVCKKHGIWLHVDGAYCGSVIFSARYRHLVEGLSEADSFSVNAHKMLGTPLTCSIIVTKHKKYLYDSFSNDAAYLYQTDGDDLNLGKTSLQCGRRNDALKFWTLWKAIGTAGLAALVERQFELADAARTYIKSNSDYTLYSYDDSISVCFNYKDIPADLLCRKLYESARLMVGHGAFQGQQFVRFVTINGGNTTQEIDDFFKELEAFANAELLTLQA